mmetsp:Transcript_13570/g.29927  ORF Transcript_13570/g.29927 Transcript_13570/m.29927 type:complete len:219 (-) Transcript_13570:1931-2587(-)
MPSSRDIAKFDRRGRSRWKAWGASMCLKSLSSVKPVRARKVNTKGMASLRPSLGLPTKKDTRRTERLSRSAACEDRKEASFWASWSSARPPHSISSTCTALMGASRAESCGIFAAICGNSVGRSSIPSATANTPLRMPCTMGRFLLGLLGSPNESWDPMFCREVLEKAARSVYEGVRPLASSTSASTNFVLNSKVTQQFGPSPRLFPASRFCRSCVFW